MRSIVLGGSAAFWTFASAVADPTFNGAFPSISCGFRDMVVCEGDYCRPEQQNAIDGRVRIDYASKQILIDRDDLPLTVTATSEPRLGSTLWVRPHARGKDNTYYLQTSFSPRGSGAYSQTAAITIKRGEQTTILTGSCGNWNKRR